MGLGPAKFLLPKALGLVVILVVGVAAVSWAGGSVAAAKDRVPVARGNVHLRLPPFMAPVLPQGSPRYVSKPITLVLEVAPEQVSTICAFTPRVVDAIIHELSRNPIPADRKANLDVRAAEGRLVFPVSRAVEGTTIHRLVILPGARDVDAKAARRLPLTEIIACGQG